MAKFNNRLANITIAAPCSADWNEMRGTDRIRFCGQCQLNVYNLSEMSRPEAENLIQKTEGRLCVRFYRRADGTVLTRNCPTGLRAVRRRLRKVSIAALSLAVSFCAGIGLQGLSSQIEATVLSALTTANIPPVELESKPAANEAHRAIPIAGQLSETPRSYQHHLGMLPRNSMPVIKSSKPVKRKKH